MFFLEQSCFMSRLIIEQVKFDNFHCLNEEKKKNSLGNNQDFMLINLQMKQN